MIMGGRVTLQPPENKIIPTQVERVFRVQGFWFVPFWVDRCLLEGHLPYNIPMERLNTSVESESSKIMRNKNETSEDVYIYKSKAKHNWWLNVVHWIYVYIRDIWGKYMDVSKNRGTPNNGKPYEQMDDLGVFPFFWKHPYGSYVFF